MGAPMPDPKTPGPRRKGKAGIVIVAAVILMAIITFVGMNMQHAKELEENPPPEGTQKNG